MSDRIDTLLQAMTLEEKVRMAAGSDLWHSSGVERLGVPRIKVTDGPNGARGASWTGATSACFPCGTALAATWNTELVQRVGQVLAEEVRSKGAHVLLAPTVNIHRSPLAGRNFECYSEDPYLTSRMAVAYISGVQSRGVGATVKHFVCNDSEFERRTISSVVSERALREIYLPPFEAAVCEAGTWALMSAYNRINGVSACNHTELLDALLKQEWGFDGVVMSDWFGTYSTVAAANAGLDLEMPGPAVFMGDKLLEAVRSGLVEEGTIDDKVRRLLRLAERTGAFVQGAEPAEGSLDLPEHRRIARAAAAEAIVLLKNDGPLLPLAAGTPAGTPAGTLSTLAVIGPNAEVAQIQGGGSAGVNPHYAISPLEGIRAAAGANVAVTFEPGCSIDKGTPPLDTRQLTAPDGQPGMHVEFFSGLEFAGSPVRTEVTPRTRLLWLGAVSPELPPQTFSLRCRGRFTPRETGTHTFSLASAGRSRLFCDGVLVLDNWTSQTRGDSFFGAGSTTITADVPMAAGEARDLVLEFVAPHYGAVAGLQLGCAAPVPVNLLGRAVALAAGSDAAIVVVGTNADWESEGGDRAEMRLPGQQDALIDAVVAANPRTVVVVNAGSPVEMDWIARTPAVVYTWFGGQELGNAVADVLFGAVNPAGRLPTTFPRRLEDTPAFINYPGENGAVLYGEGIFVGYRYYDKKRIAPRFCFGHGLSYTTFAYSALTLDRTGYGPLDTIQVTVDVTNTGAVVGQEVVQLYVGAVESRLARPERELKGFTKVHLDPGETRTVRFTLDSRALACWDPGRQAWDAEPGEYEVLVGASSRDLRARTGFTLVGGRGQPAAGSGG